MKKILSIVTLLGIGTAAFAQSIKVGPEAGVTLTTMSQKLKGISGETNYQLGFRIGGTADFQINEYFSIQPGAFLSLNNGTESYFERNYKTDAGTPAGERDRRNYGISYIQVPVYALYKTGKEYDDPHFFVGIGPSFNFAVGGWFKQDFDRVLNGVPTTSRYDHSAYVGNDRKKDQIRFFDLSANATVGYELPFGLYFRAYYGIGLLNVAPGGDSDNCFRNSGGGISVGFFFNAKGGGPRWQ
ncbi:porin family protein [Taibaiella helva]|uniref:porin family protein n=1 Tax=Taibaiella helva TaxID=2301235 RepID=UPI0013008BB5|nr:porin family protein [Taibaiella helva]